METGIFELKRSVSFFLEKRKDPSGALIINNVPIRIAISYGGKRLMLNAGYRIDASKWHEEKQRAKNNTTQKGGLANEINGKLNTLENGINEFFKACEVKKVNPTLFEVKAVFDRLSKNKQEKKETFFTAFDRFTQTCGRENDWQEDTYEKFSVTRRHLESFDKNLSFENLNADRMIDYLNYLRSKRDLRNTTIVKNFSFVKWFLRWAAKNQYPVNQGALDFNPKLKGTDGKIKKVIFLSLDELTHLYRFEIPASKEYLTRVRDVFVFCCFSGLRYSDVFSLKKSDDRGSYFEFVTQKTSESLKVETNKYSRAILDKYKEMPFKGDKALPVISNQKMNDYIKELGELAGLDTPETLVYYKGNRRVEETYPKYALLSTHCARKTFVTNLIYLGVSDHVIRQWTGHRDHKSFDVYHKIVDDIKAREMAKFDDV
ncbi:phage integrase SAM-like domain-containing protein [Spirosoma areae]